MVGILLMEYDQHLELVAWTPECLPSLPTHDLALLDCYVEQHLLTVIMDPDFLERVAKTFSPEHQPRLQPFPGASAPWFPVQPATLSFSDSGTSQSLGTSPDLHTLNPWNSCSGSYVFMNEGMFTQGSLEIPLNKIRISRWFLLSHSQVEIHPKVKKTQKLP